jgi:hemoglobin-like flavoprotein
MPMEANDVTLIKESFAAVMPAADETAALFYGRLFEIAPAVKPLFKGDMREQGRKLMGTLAFVVQGLGDLPSILPPASALARRHVNYGVKPEHYDPVGEALLWTLEQRLGQKWTSETAAAWTKAYTTLSGYMIAEAYGAKPQ